MTYTFHCRLWVRTIGGSHFDVFPEIPDIDCYEDLTNDDRPCRSAMPPYEALNLIKNDVVAGKFDKSLFEKFTYSLTQ